MTDSERRHMIRQGVSGEFRMIPLDWVTVTRTEPQGEASDYDALYHEDLICLEAE